MWYIQSPPISCISFCPRKFHNHNFFLPILRPNGFQYLSWWWISHIYYYRMIWNRETALGGRAICQQTQLFRYVLQLYNHLFHIFQSFIPPPQGDLLVFSSKHLAFHSISLVYRLSDDWTESKIPTIVPGVDCIASFWWSIRDFYGMLATEGGMLHLHIPVSIC